MGYGDVVRTKKAASSPVDQARAHVGLGPRWIGETERELAIDPVTLSFLGCAQTLEDLAKLLITSGLIDPSGPAVSQTRPTFGLVDEIQNIRYDLFPERSPLNYLSSTSTSAGQKLQTTLTALTVHAQHYRVPKRKLKCLIDEATLELDHFTSALAKLEPMDLALELHCLVLARIVRLVYGSRYSAKADRIFVPISKLREEYTCSREHAVLNKYRAAAEGLRKSKGLKRLDEDYRRMYALEPKWLAKLDSHEAELEMAELELEVATMLDEV